MATTTVADIMDADTVSATPKEDVRTVIDRLKQNELPGLPVVDDDNKVIGIVTDSDLVISDEEADLHLPTFVNIMGGIVFLGSMKHFDEKVKKAFATDVEEMMTADPITVRPDEPAERAARLIAESKHNRLPVVDDDGRLVGVVTRVDVLAAVTDAD